MTEGITYNDLGTIDVTFDDETYHLGRPKFGQVKYFTRQVEDASKSVRDRLQELRDAVAEAEGDEEKRLSEELTEFARAPYYERTIPILTEMFKQLSDKPLPTDTDEWPGWLAVNSGILTEIITHWRNVPKVSGANGENP
jgi:hypothetical protein